MQLIIDQQMALIIFIFHIVHLILAFRLFSQLIIKVRIKPKLLTAYLASNLIIDIGLLYLLGITSITLFMIGLLLEIILSLVLIVMVIKLKSDH